MPLVVAHAFLGASVIAITRKPISWREDAKVWLLGAALGILPDLDLFFTWILGLGIKWHGGFTHSIVFAAFWGLLVSRFASKGRNIDALICSLAILSHGLLDAVVKKTYTGTMLLWPFSTQKYKLGWFNYFAFYPDSKLDPMRVLIWRAIQISFYELLIFGSVFLVVVIVRRGLKR